MPIEVVSIASIGPKIKAGKIRLTAGIHQVFRGLNVFPRAPVPLVFSGRGWVRGEVLKPLLRFFQCYLTLLKVLTGFTPGTIGLFAKNVFANFFQVLYFWVFGATDILVFHKSNSNRRF
jgi:hypothetical protein